MFLKTQYLCHNDKTSFGIIHAASTRETPASARKNISGNSLFGWIPCQWYCCNGLQVILLQRCKCFGSWAWRHQNANEYAQNIKNRVTSHYLYLPNMLFSPIWTKYKTFSYVTDFWLIWLGFLAHKAQNIIINPLIDCIKGWQTITHIL